MEKLQSTAMLESLSQIKARLAEPVSQMEIIRQSLLYRAMHMDKPQMPLIFNDNQRQVFIDHIDKVAAFLESEDGSDALELLVTTFLEFSERYSPKLVETSLE